MAISAYPDEYLKLNSQQTKQLAIVISIDGLDDILGNVPIFTSIKYGDPGLVYGLDGAVYGGLRLISNARPYIMVDGGLTIQQKIEPEQGKGAISTVSVQFIDKDGYMSKLVAPGVLVDELLGNKLCTFRLGFVNSSFPEDYFVVFRGFVTQMTSAPGRMTLQFSDANVQRRQTFCFSVASTLTSAITTVTTAIPVSDASGFFQPILGINGAYDPDIKTYLKIDDEIMNYGPTGIVGNIVNVTRGGGNARGTNLANHDINAAVMSTIQLQDNCITLALKIMLSGWNGPWITGEKAFAIGTTLDPLRPFTNAIIITKDAHIEYGLTIGDQVIVSGSTAGNDGPYLITDIQDHANGASRLLLVDTNLNYENPASTVGLGFRSKYDTFPVECGLKQTPREVDVLGHEQIRTLFFSSDIYRIQLYFESPQDNAKEIIEMQCFLPYSIYSITRFGRISIGVTKPPLASDKLVYLDNTTISNPETIQIQRATNTRRFFNVIQYQYDLADNGVYESTDEFVDSESLTKTNIVQALPIAADGVKSSLGGNVAVQARARFLLNRYKNGAFELNLKVNWAVGSLIEVTDPVVVVDNGQLQITNFNTGERNLGTALYEVIQRTLSIKDGSVTLTLLSSLGVAIDDRFATISPSSLVVSGSTTSSIRFKDSYGALYPGNEKKKWEKFFGLPIHVHSADYSVSGVTTLVNISMTDPYVMIVDPPLGFTPLADYIIDVADYPSTDTDPETQALYKLLFSFLSYSIAIVSGTSQTVFTVSAPDALHVQNNLRIIVRNSSFSILSPESKVLSVIGTVVTVETPLGFTPAAGQFLELGGFADGGASYRFL